MLVVVIDPHVGAVHQFHYRRVDAVGADVQLVPQCLAFFRGQLQGGIGRLPRRQNWVMKKSANSPAITRSSLPSVGISKKLCRFMQAAGIDNLVFPALAGGNLLQGAHQHTAVIGVGGGAGGNLAQQVACGNGIGIGAANPQMSFGGNAAGTHVAQAAADAVGAELALWLLQLVTVKDRAHLSVVGNFHHINRGLIHRDRLASDISTRGRHQRFSCWAANNLANKAFMANRASESGRNCRDRDTVRIERGHVPIQWNTGEQGKSGSLDRFGNRLRQTSAGHAINDQAALPGRQGDFIGQGRDASCGANAAHGAIGNNQQIVDGKQRAA